MEEESVDIVINPDGTIEVDLVGFKGDACEAVLKKLTKQLGNLVSSKRKQDYYQNVKVRVREVE